MVNSFAERICISICFSTELFVLVVKLTCTKFLIKTHFCCRSVCTGSEADAHLEKSNEVFYYRSVCTGSEIVNLAKLNANMFCYRSVCTGSEIDKKHYSVCLY